MDEQIDGRFHKSYDVKCSIVFLGNFAEMAALEALQNVNICAILNITGINEKVDCIEGYSLMPVEETAFEKE